MHIAARCSGQNHTTTPAATVNWCPQLHRLGSAALAAATKSGSARVPTERMRPLRPRLSLASFASAKGATASAADPASSGPRFSTGPHGTSRYGGFRAPRGGLQEPARNRPCSAKQCFANFWLRKPAKGTHHQHQRGSAEGCVALLQASTCAFRPMGAAFGLALESGSARSRAHASCEYVAQPSCSLLALLYSKRRDRQCRRPHPLSSFLHNFGVAMGSHQRVRIISISGPSPGPGARIISISGALGTLVREKALSILVKCCSRWFAV